MAATLTGLIESIITELTRIQTMPMPYREKDDEFPLPRMIDAGNGGGLFVSGKLDQGIVAVADQLMNTDATLLPRYTRTEWRAEVRRAFGPALAAVDLDDDVAKNGEAVLGAIRANLGKHASGHGAREHAFGCTLLGNTDIQPFAIGPVRFEPRLVWLARKHQEGFISSVTRRRIEQNWSGKRVRRRKPSRDHMRESDILDAIGACAFVCSVMIDGLAAEAGREKALTAARLATAAIALFWQTPSKALAGLNLLFDRSARRQKTLTFVPGKIVLAGSNLSHMPHGPWLKTGEWEKTFAKNRDMFAVVSDILNYAVSPTGAVARPKMMNALVQSLLWFHEGCRETVTLMAIVKFSAALEALADGGKAGGIRRLVNARLGIQDSMTIRRDGPTLKQAVDEIYSDGRSRTVHGTNDKLGHDWTGTRSLAEQFARLCLLHCIDWVAENCSCDDPSQLSQ